MSNDSKTTSFALIVAAMSPYFHKNVNDCPRLAETYIESMITTSPPGPKRHWLRGNLTEFQRDRLSYLTHCARTYGDIVALRLGPRRIFLLFHPNFIEQVLVTNNHCFRKHFGLRINPLVLGNGLLTSEGDFWLRQRRLIQPAFSRARLTGYATAMIEATQRLLAGWSAGQTREIYAEMMALTLAIAARTLFSASVDEGISEVGAAMQFLQENFIKRFDSLFIVPMWLPTPQNLRIRRAVRRLDSIIYGFIHQRRHSGEAKNDLLSILLHARDEDGSRMTDRQLRDEAMTLFLAGHETTALVLSWSWYLLGQHPEVEERVASEVGKILAGRVPTLEDVPRLTLLEQVVLEAMRLYSPAYLIGREALEDCEVGGYRVQRGTTVLMPQWVVHRDPRFFADPEAFRPQRWTPEFQKQLPRFAYFPFGGGPRLCIGNTFAMMEMVLVLSLITQKYRFTLQPGHGVQPWPTFTLRPRSGILAPLVARTS
jgi:cytochrome P450